MDLSKLPRLSKTPTPPPEAAATSPDVPSAVAATNPCPYCKAPLRTGARFCDACGAQLSGRAGGAISAGPEPWVGIIIGILLLLMFPNIIKYGSSKVFHTSFAPFIDPETNQEVPYPHLNVFWSDLAVTAFAAALLLEGAVLLVWVKPKAVLLTFVVTVAATLGNLIYLVGTYSNYGLATASIIAVVIGVYMAIYQWKLFQALRQ